LSLPLFESVRAGFPTPASEENRYDIDIDSYLIEHPASTVLVRIKGDSMRDAGILEGDMGIVERGREPRSGDIVLAVVDGDYTVKYFYKDKARVILRPANPAYSDIVARESIEIYGVMTGSVRKYQ
jgi:repressor LexA